MIHSRTFHRTGGPRPVIAAAILNRTRKKSPTPSIPVISGSEELSATPVATVAGAGFWDHFAESSPQFPLVPPEVGSGTNTQTSDATDEQIDRDIQIVNEDKNVFRRGLNHNEASDIVTDQGIAVIGGVAHQMNRVIHDWDASTIFSTPSVGDGAAAAQISSDVEDFVPIMTKTALAEALPGYK